MRIWTAALAAGALAASFGAAEAHPRLISSNPTANAKVHSPGEVRLEFSETLIPRFCHIALADRSGHSVSVGPVSVSPDRKQIAVPIRRKLAPGLYRLAWQAVSTDTHRVKGAYAFTVTP